MRTFFLVLFLISATYADDYIEFTDFTMASSFNDFAAIEFNVEGVYALEEIVWGTTSTTYVDYIIDFYNGSSWDLVAVSNDFVNNPTPPIYNPLYFDDDATVPDIWVKGNGTFRISVFGVAWLGYDEVDDHTFTVTDDTAPASIANAAKSWSSSHPHISWDANTEIDLQYYEVWKKRNSGSWTLKTTTTNTYYTDTSEMEFSPPGSKDYVYYKMRAVDYLDNESSYTSTFTFIVNQWQQNVIALDLSQQAKLSEYILSENYPNPFNPSTKISFALPEQSNISLKVYNIAGKEIATLTEGSQAEGHYDVSFDGSRLSSGVYIYRFTAKGLESGKTHNEVKRMLLVK